jgi:hypothetical protein
VLHGLPEPAAGDALVHVGMITPHASPDTVIRIEESPRLLSLWIGKAVWTRDNERGHIDGVVFKNITAAANPLIVQLQGFDETHLVENVLFQDVVVNGAALSAADVKTNAFVKGVSLPAR